MSDPDAMPDPVDKAHARAEAMLSDDDARAARRARVLAAVARQPAASPAPVTPPTRRPAWRPGGWLAAASVAGLAVFFASRIYQPPPRAPQAAPSVPAVRAPASASPPATARAPSAPVAVKAPSPSPRSFAAPPPPPTSRNSPEALSPQAFPAEAAPPPPPKDAKSEPGASAPAARDQSRGLSEPALGGMNAARRTEKPAFAAPPPPPPASPVIAAPAAAPAPGLESSAEARPDLTVRLRAAAAAGRTADLAAVLDQGVPVDAADAAGNTALMKSIEADHPAAARLLRRHGASLDRRNHAGDSARGLAAAKGDADLDAALGLRP
jgi:hypothetical protein